MKRLLQACSPHHHPYRWLLINSIVLVWSTILLARIWATHVNHNDGPKTIIKWHYLLYNFGTSGVWLIEVFFNILDYKKYFDPGEGGVGEESLLQPTRERFEWTKRETIALWAEAAFAVFSFIDSIVVAIRLNREQIHRQAEGMSFDVCVNMLAYAFLVYRQFDGWRSLGNETFSPRNNVELSEGVLV